MRQSRKVTIILSIVAAIAVWAYVIAIENPPTTREFRQMPVQLMSVETLAQSELALLEGMDATVDIVVSGKRADINKLTREDMIFTANVFGLTRLGEHWVHVEHALPSSISLEEIRSESILVKLDHLVSIYKPVNIYFEGEFEPDTEVGNITIQPEQIEVRGAKTLVESVSYVGIDIPVEDVEALGSTLLLPTTAYNAQDQPVPHVRLSSGFVEVNATMYYTKTVPLITEIVGQINEQFEITNIDIPPDVTLRGSRSVLARIELLTSEPIDLSEITATRSIPIRVALPAGVEFANRSRGVSVKIDIKGISMADFEYESSEIMAENLDPEHSVYFNTPSLTLRAVGREAVLAETGKADFHLSVDLADLGLGTHTVPVVVTYDKIMNSVEIDPMEVHVTITVTPEEVDRSINEVPRRRGSGYDGNDGGNI